MDSFKHYPKHLRDKRDRQIYRMFMFLGKTRTEIAEHFGLTYSRINQILGERDIVGRLGTSEELKAKVRGWLKVRRDAQ